MDRKSDTQMEERLKELFDEDRGNFSERPGAAQEGGATSHSGRTPSTKRKKAKRESRTSDWIFRIIILALLCVIGYSGYQLIKIQWNYHKGASTYEDFSQLAGEPDVGKIAWEELKAQNEDVVGWLYSEDTVINYPVVQGTDNDFYLEHLVNKEWNGAGTLFIDYQCENPLQDFNTILYGHHMKDGSMFQSLVNYRDTEGYYKEHAVMQLYTPEQDYDLEIFGAATIPADSDRYRYYFGEPEDKTSYITWIQDHNEIPGMEYGQVPVTADDTILMMSTCTYEFENARLVVWAKIVPRAGASSGE